MQTKLKNLRTGVGAENKFRSTVELEVTETQPILKGATATGSYKPAKLETGVTIQVPPFIRIGDRIRIGPSEGKYLERIS